MSSPGGNDTLASCVAMGGEVWLAGGVSAYCTVVAGNRDEHDTKYGARLPVVSYALGEIGPGRMMYDGAHCRSEFIMHNTVTTPRRVTTTAGGRTSPGWDFGRPVSAPDDANLPQALRRRAAALRDSLPPTCLGNATRCYANTLPAPVEYLREENRVMEHLDPGPRAESRHAVLDSLCFMSGGQLATLCDGMLPVSMAYDHGTEAPRFVISGFDLWTWSRQDVVGLAEFVLHDALVMARTAQAPRAPVHPAARPGTAAPSVAPRPGGAVPALPGRSRSR